jgi:type II secretion system protein N
MRERRLRLAGYGVFAAILFFAFVTASFPYADTLSALIAPMSMKVVFQRQAMSFPIGARLENVRLISITNEQTLLQSPGVTVSPGVVCFFLFRPCLRIRAQIYGGMIDVTVHQSARTTIVDSEFESLKLAHLSRTAGESEDRTSRAEGNGQGDAPLKLGVTLSGELSGSGSARVTGQDLDAGNASMILLGRHVEAAVVNGLPPLDLGIVRGKVLVAQGVATLQLRAYGSDGELEANGRIRLAPDIANSTVQITVSLTPTTKGRASFGFLLNMLPHAPGDGPYHVDGALRSPSVS